MTWAGARPRHYHALKCWPAFFQAVVDGRKPFEVRRDDRGFRVGDVLVLYEWDAAAGAYTGRVHRAVVTFLLTGKRWGVRKGFCVMGIRSEGAQ